MPVSGLVITLDADSDLASKARAHLLQFPEIELGESNGRRLAAVADSPLSGTELLDLLRACEGIEHIDVVFVEVQSPLQSDQQQPEPAR